MTGGTGSKVSRRKRGTRIAAARSIKPKKLGILIPRSVAIA
jgi:hypothetical protein